MLPFIIIITIIMIIINMMMMMITIMMIIISNISVKIFDITINNDIFIIIFILFYDRRR